MWGLLSRRECRAGGRVFGVEGVSGAEGQDQGMEVAGGLSTWPLVPPKDVTYSAVPCQLALGGFGVEEGGGSGEVERGK